MKAKQLIRKMLTGRNLNDELAFGYNATKRHGGILGQLTGQDLLKRINFESLTDDYRLTIKGILWMKGDTILTSYQGQYPPNG